MDVTCERCGTEYEFDETLLSGRGTSVKCTNCGHVFKVYPKALETADAGPSSWKLRTTSGFVDTIETLRELQRRIGSGDLTPDDEIARGDEDWKKLGSIPELETFFQAAGVPIASSRIPSPLPPAAPGSRGRESSLPPGKRPRQPTLLGVSPVQRIPAPAAVPESVPAPDSTPPESARASESVRESASEQAADSVSPPLPEYASEPDILPEYLPSAAEGSYRSPYTRDSLADTAAIEPEDAIFEEQHETSLQTSTAPPPYYDDDDDIPELPARGTSPLRWLLIIVVVGGLALVATQWTRVAGILGIGGDPALIASNVAEGDDAIAEGYTAAYANAIEAYGRAVEAGGDADVEVLAKLSNAYALAAQAQLDGGAAVESVTTLLDAAVSTAEAATSIDPRALAATLASADALRLTGRNEEARAQLEEARTMPFSRIAEFYRVEARLAAAEAGGKLEEGLRSARQAAELEPDAIRYGLLLARVERAAGHDEQAQKALEAILAAHPQHPVATSLLAELQAKAEDAPATESETARATEVETDAGTELADDVPPETEAAPAMEQAAAAEPAEEPAKEPASEPGGAKVTAGATARAEVAPSAEPSRPKARDEKKPQMDEYDRLAQAARSDAFVDGRPPILDYESTMKKGREELEAGQYARARAYFDSALEVHPGSADAMDALGDVATAVNDYASALRYYRVAAQRGHPDGYFKLGQTYERLGRNEEAVSAYYTYVKRRPTGTYAEAARTAIRTLEPRAKLPPEP
ncbi:MAG: zinc-ribbon domain-containing protein, partial [Deltaproteobacteria bacterium]|nr:zinc-ribbon domain-containing protein [Deltaproteobacteria bacterium]